MKFNEKNNDHPSNKGKDLVAYLSNLSANQLTLLAMSSGYILGQYLTENEQGSIGNFFITIGQILLTLNAQNEAVREVNVPEINSQEIEEIISLLNEYFLRAKS